MDTAFLLGIAVLSGVMVLLVADFDQPDKPPGARS